MNTKQQKKVEDALIKKAVGYEVEEVVEEFSVDDNQKPTLVKKKRSTKHFPPDISAIKILLSYYGEKTFDELNGLSDEELFAERDKLLEELQKFKKE